MASKFKSSWILTCDSLVNYIQCPFKQYSVNGQAFNPVMVSTIFILYQIPVTLCLNLSAKYKFLAFCKYIQI